MAMRSSTRGARLPYQVLAGVVPCPKGWLAATAKLQGITLAPEQPQVFSKFLDILDYKPAYQVVAVFLPIGLLDEPEPKGRSCERAARRALGWPRAAAISSAPVRKVLACSTYEEAVVANGGTLNPVTWYACRKIAEIDKDIAPYWQRTVFEVHPELSFCQLNEQKPMRFPKRSQMGKEERRATLAARFAEVDRVLESPLPGISMTRLLDAAACLWTARRVMARAVTRYPENPEWDSAGLRMEFVS